MINLHEILPAFNLDSTQYHYRKIDTGHINSTLHLIGPQEFILQKVNKNVFKNPELIVNNVNEAKLHLKQNFPDYFFVGHLMTTDGKGLVHDENADPWRLFPFIKDTYTIDTVDNVELARSATIEFARLVNYLSGCDVSLFKETIPHFHDLTWRYREFEAAMENGRPDRLENCSDLIVQIQSYKGLVAEYQKWIQSGNLKLRLMHNDTKINNVLFDKKSGGAVCVIDLDTLMPGYFIYDLGDMIRTFVSSVSEEESELNLISVRKNIKLAVEEAYLTELDVLTTEEVKAVDFAGPMMTYIMALRFATDYLLGDVYFRTVHPEQNLIRAKNQLRLLALLTD